MKSLSLRLFLGLFFISQAAQTACMNRLRSLGAVVAMASLTAVETARSAIQNKRAETSYYSKDGSIRISNVTGNDVVLIINGQVINGESANCVVGSGNQTQKTVQIPHSPTGVDVSIGHLIFKRGDADSLVVKADDNIHPCLEQIVSPTSILFRRKEGCCISCNTNSIEYILTLRASLKDLTASGRSTIAADIVEGNRVNLKADGNSEVNISTLRAQVLTAALNDRSKVVVAGSAATQSVECSANSCYDASGLVSQSKGSGICTLAASDRSTITVGKTKTDEMKLKADSNSKVYISGLEAQNLTAALNDRSKVVVAGSVATQSVECSANSCYDASGLVSQSKGSGICNLVASDRSTIATGNIDGARVKLEADSNSQVNISTSAQSLTVKLRDRSKAGVTGSVVNQSVECSEKSYYNGSGLESQSTEVNMSDRSDAKVYAKNSVSGAISGKSTLEIGGRPHVNVDSSDRSRWLFV